jgi:hypothetical protein
VCENDECVAPAGGTDTDSIDATLSGGTMSTAGSDTSTTGSTEPHILSFTTSVSSITEGGFVTFTAELADPDGLDDIVSANLTTPDLAGSYGALTDNGMGVFTLGLSWDDIHAVVPLEFSSNVMRPFLLTVTDSTDQAASDTAELQLTCSGLDACDGICTDTQIEDEHCGACNNVCPVGGGAGGCNAGACEPTFHDCVEPADATTCADYCVAQGETCVEDGCGTATYVLYSDTQACTDFTASVAQGTPCAAPINFALAPGYGFARCCCTVGG